jgi:hypothetical protein
LSAGRKTLRQGHRRPCVAALLLLLAWCRTARADTRLELACPELTREQAAELEARIRASLLTATVVAERVSITCRAEGGNVLVESGVRQVGRELALTGADPREQLLAAVEAALRELSETPASAAPAETPPAAARESPAPAPAASLPALSRPVSSSPVALVPAAPALVVRRAPSSPRFLQLSLGARGEPWPDGLALGGELGAGYGTQVFAIGVVGAGVSELESRDEFVSSEWSAALCLTWQPRWALGFRGQLGGGPSLLLVTPRAELSARSTTQRSAWFGELVLSRPIRLGPAWAVIPGLGARAFTAQRSVNVDGQRELELRSVVPRLGLGVSYTLR